MTKMNDALYRRGPDDQGIWLDGENNIALGHRRLAVIDLSEKGKQPMRSACGRYVIVYNGEIYNFRSIRKELEKEGVSIDGDSDTAVLLASIVKWGIKSSIKKAHGMFAFSLWDSDDKVLYLVRDRLGEKPLYYGYSGNQFLFASELKSLTSFPEWRGEIDRDVLTLQLRYGYIPAPYSIYKGIFKLLPGSILKLPLEDLQYRKELNPGGQSIDKNSLSPQRYWSARSVAETAVNNKVHYTKEEAVNTLQDILGRTIKNQMIADVPLGAFLSGGIDSSIVVALMQSQSINPVRTFTIGFHEARFNEAKYAKKVADHIGTDHTEMYITSKEAMEVIPDLPGYYDEPFSDPSQIPTYLVSKLAKEQVTVCLSGDGGDELFAGYERYFWAMSVRNIIESLPMVARKTFASILQRVPIPIWDMLLTTFYPVLPKRFHFHQPGEKLNKLGDLLRTKDFELMYRRLISQIGDPAKYVLGSTEPETVLSMKKEWPQLSDDLETMQYLDTVSYLPDDILVKLDRASMGISLESRVPLLDHKIVEFAWSLPRELKVQDKTGKCILKDLLYKYVPRELVDRPKMGFGVPIGEWLRGGMREWAEDLLDLDMLERQGILNSKSVRKMWVEHKSGKRNWEYQLWNILVFQSWHQKQISRI
jgi:asparagine synthase (glutamine-hydrolysing)